MNLVELIEKEQIKREAHKFNVGDTVKVHFKIVEGNKERVQIFEGLVIARKNGSIRETFTVRKISFGVGVERTFPIHSPRIDKVEVVREGEVRRAKLYYIRDLSGKAGTKVKEKKQITAGRVKTETRSEAEKLQALKSNKAKTVKPGAKKATPKTERVEVKLAKPKTAPKPQPKKAEATETELTQA